MPVTSKLPCDDGQWAGQQCPSIARAAMSGAHFQCGTIRLPTRADHVRTARRFTDDLLTRWSLPEENRASVLLVVSELATNAVQHGRVNMAVTVALAGSTLHVEVADFGEPAAPPYTHCADATDEDEHGRGLDIVKSLADHTEILQENGGWRARAAISISAAC
ncbi:ATP-binding protein [Streptomyces sp. I4(2020)]|uniref:ATP-binding protein n=1 Tax=Streptomyces sp. I4(2020) TaxID=2760981 RepID=UPI0018EEA258|nr:ATP-binding protein [Streptomyces sp. I4(2020)]MBJ6613861.1 ATP-binding protein [Streptomyces sp. I3(2020)]MBJ6628784.1 ATP-binding protein [Streptomyces sp. I4(2020)]